MSWQIPFYLTSLLLSGTLSGFLALYAWRHRQFPGSRPYAGLACCEFILVLAELLSVFSPSSELALLWFKVRYTAVACIGLLWLLFALEFSGRTHWQSRPTWFGLLALPVLTQALLWSNDLHHLWASREVGFHRFGPLWLADPASRLPGPGYLAHVFYTLALVLAGIILLLRAAWNMRQEYRLQALSLAGAGLVAFVFSINSLFGLLPRTVFNPFTPGLGLSLLLVALAIFRFQFLRRSPPAQPPPGDADLSLPERRSLALVMMVYLLLVTGISAFAYLSYASYAGHFRSEVEDQLAAIANLKVDGLADWRAERLGDAESLRRNPALAALVQAYLDQPSQAQATETLQAWLDSLRAAYGYDRVSLLHPQAGELLASPVKPEPPDSHLVVNVQSTLASGKVLFIDFHRHAADQNIYLTLLAPLYAQGDPNRPLGVVALRINPAAQLYPYLNLWPGHSQSAETLLVRREADSIVYLTPVRFRPDAALNLRIPLTETQVLAVKAALGQTGLVEGRDYRGQKVVGYIRPVPSSPWLLVARMDTAEVYAPLRQRLWQTILFFGLLLAASGAGLGLLWRQQQARYYQAQLRTLENLRATEEKFRLAFETSPDALAITRLADGRFVSVNRGFERILGYRAEEVLGKSSLELDLWVEPQVWQEINARLRAEGRVENFEALFRARDGGLRHGLMSAALISLDSAPHILNITRDISERKRAEGQREMLFNILAASLNEIYIFDADTLKFQFVNSGALQNLQLSLEQARQLTPLDIKPEFSAAGFQELVAPLRSGQKVVQVFETVHRRADGSLYPVEVHLQLFQQENVFLAIIQDNTERKQIEKAKQEYHTRLENEVEQRTRELRIAQEQLLRQERLATLGQVAGSIAHELRNPLGVISNAVYFLNLISDQADPRLREYLDIIENETRTAEKIVTDLLDHSRIKAPYRRPTAVADLVEQALERFPPAPQVQLSLHLPPDLPPVNIDPSQLVQVLGNLLTNACQAMPQGGTLTLAAGLDGGQLALSVSDTGEGIAPENLPRLFEPLFTTKTKGIGLGLSLSKSLVEANEGRIEAHSQPGQGATFTVYLPVIPPAAG